MQPFGDVRIGAILPEYDDGMTVASLSDEPSILVIHTDREKAALLTVGSFVLAMTSLALLTNEPFHMASPSLMNYVFGALGLVMFGPGLLVLLGSIFLDLPRLTLTEEGFRVSHLRGSAFYSWQSVSAFTARGRMVSMDLDPTMPNLRRLRRFNRRWFGGEASISPYEHGMSALDLADLLNNWRDRYVFPQGR